MLSRTIGRTFPVAALGLVVASAAWNHWHLESSLLTPGRSWPSPSERHVAIERVLAEIPPAAAVAATSATYPHVASRERAYWFPAVNDAEYVAIDAADSTDPISPKETRARAAALVTDGRYRIADAAPHFEKAAELNPNYRDGLLELASLYEAQKQSAEAIAIYQKFPDNPGAQERLGELLLASGQAARR